jgi:hypothetical protein
LKTRFTGDTPSAGDRREMALRAGLVASQRLWFTSVNGYGSCERGKSVRSRKMALRAGRHAALETHPHKVDWLLRNGYGSLA